MLMGMDTRFRSAESRRTLGCISWDCRGCIAEGRAFCSALETMPLIWQPILRPATPNAPVPLCDNFWQPLKVQGEQLFLTLSASPCALCLAQTRACQPNEGCIDSLAGNGRHCASPHYPRVGLRRSFIALRLWGSTRTPNRFHSSHGQQHGNSPHERIVGVPS